jgi:flagellar protein FliO/FliZ
MAKLFWSLFSTLLMSTSVAANEAASLTVNHSQNIWQMIIGLFTVIALIFAVVWLMKKIGYGQFQTTNVLKIKGCLSLSTKEKIFLIEAGSEQLLIGVAPGSVTHIKSLEFPIEDEQAGPVTSAFAEKLKSILNKGEAVE